MTGITSVPEEGDTSPWNHIRAQPVPWGDQSVLAPILTTPGVPTWSRHLLQVFVSLHQSEGQVLCSSAFFSHLEGDPGITWGRGGVHFLAPGTSVGYRVREQEPLPNGVWWSYLAVASKMLQKWHRKYDWPVRIRLKPRWLEERKVYYVSQPAPGYLQNGTGPKLRVFGVFISKGK
jgi:hypothetical protein